MPVARTRATINICVTGADWPAVVILQEYAGLVMGHETDSALQLLVRGVLERSQQIRDDYTRLHELTCRLHGSINAPRYCPVCRSTELSPVNRNNLRSEPAKESSVLGYRCSNGHLFTHP